MDVAFLLPEGSLTTDVGYAQKSALTWSAAPETQSAVIMDETTFSVPQSQGRGNCGQAEDQQFPKKDYLVVQTGGYAKIEGAFPSSTSEAAEFVIFPRP